MNLPHERIRAAAGFYILRVNQHLEKLLKQ